MSRRRAGRGRRGRGRAGWARRRRAARRARGRSRRCARRAPPRRPRARTRPSSRPAGQSGRPRSPSAGDGGRARAKCVRNEADFPLPLDARAAGPSAAPRRPRRLARRSIAGVRRGGSNGGPGVGRGRGAAVGRGAGDAAAGGVVRGRARRRRREGRPRDGPGCGRERSRVGALGRPAVRPRGHPPLPRAALPTPPRPRRRCQRNRLARSHDPAPPRAPRVRDGPPRVGPARTHARPRGWRRRGRDRAVRRGRRRTLGLCLRRLGRLRIPDARAPGPRVQDPGLRAHPARGRRDGRPPGQRPPPPPGGCGRVHDLGPRRVARPLRGAHGSHRGRPRPASLRSPRGLGGRAALALHDCGRGRPWAPRAAPRA